MNRVVLEWNNGSYIVVSQNSQSDLDQLFSDYGPPDTVKVYVGEVPTEYKNPKNVYTVEIDGRESKVEVETLAELANKIRGTGKHFRVWSPTGIPLIDTKFGDAYGLIT